VLKGKTLAVDSTTLEANAAMRSMVHRVSQKSWRAYLTQLATEAGIENPTGEDLRRMDRKRKGKKVSNTDWESPSDPDSRIARMKDGRTHFAYKAEHPVDVESDLIVAAEIDHASDPDTDTVLVTTRVARETLEAVDNERTGEELLGDKGYHKAETIDPIERELGMRTYIPEPKLAHQRVWIDKPPEHKEAVYRNRRRVRGARVTTIPLMASRARRHQLSARSCAPRREPRIPGLFDGLFVRLFAVRGGPPPPDHSLHHGEKSCVRASVMKSGAAMPRRSGCPRSATPDSSQPQGLSPSDTGSRATPRCMPPAHPRAASRRRRRGCR
jgi:transposase